MTIEAQRRVQAEDVPLIKAMLIRGDLQSDIAAYFGINSGRIAEIHLGNRFADIAPASEDALPPRGPYLAARSAIAARNTLIRLRTEIDAVLAQLDLWETTRR
jgi:predicted oxidoreductase